MTTSVLPEISDQFNPSLVFGPNDSVLTAPIYAVLEEPSLTFFYVHQWH